MLKSHTRNIFFLISTIVILGVFGCSQNMFDDKTQDFSEEKLDSSYENAIKSFTEINVAEFQRKVSNDDTFFVYFGRSTCPYCREFVPDLKLTSDKKQILVYYVNTEHTDINKELKLIRDEFGVEFVPSLLYMQSGERKDMFESSGGDNLDNFFENNM